MILVLGGTREGREITCTLADMGYQVTVTVASGIGAELLPAHPGVAVLVGRLDAAGLCEVVSRIKPLLIIDATHPYASQITENAWQAAKACGIPYIRYQRPPVADKVPDDKVYRVNDYTEAARVAVGLGQTVFLTTGSSNIKPFCGAAGPKKNRIVARVLPGAGVVERCVSIGLSPEDVICERGPFTLEQNLAMLEEYRADVLVTKDSGSTGGTEAKLEAARRLGIPVVMVARPDCADIPQTESLDEIINMAKKTID